MHGPARICGSADPGGRGERRRPALRVRGPAVEYGAMVIHVVMQPLLALLAGILILLMPRLLNYVVAAYLILIGIAGLLPTLMG